MTRLKDRYNKEIVTQLMKKHKYSNIMEVPRLTKIVLNIGLGESLSNPKAMEAAEKDLTAIAGQHAVVTKAKKSIASFKLRAGVPIGLMVTLRDKRMYEFFDKLVSVVLPRIRDFQGISRDAFDGQGNYTLGLKEQIVFPEIEYDKVDKIRGLEITIVTTAKTDEDGRRLLEAMGMPFKKN
ncbi:MAG: 50S ribosomal protein L5 [Dehalococcoidia bacterium]|nr:50S ribosomal protein L5 [Dehalococcoidia bacterium]MDD5494620.1 50S ribosomal protein L5 [Dehalococcoidia bacterium]